MTAHSDKVYSQLKATPGEWKSLKELQGSLGFSEGSLTKVKKELQEMPGIEFEDRKGQKVRLWFRFVEKEGAAYSAMPHDLSECKVDAVKHLIPVVRKLGPETAKAVYLEAIDFLAV